MCGITGFFSPDGAVDAKGFYDAHRLIAHRGPDDEGFAALVGAELAQLRGDDTIEHFAALPHVRTVGSTRLMLGHRRLSIIDLSWRGHEPFVSSDGRYHVIYNGEVYNYIELRDQLARLGHSFVTDSDIEVLTEAYAEWGNAAFNRFNGMWAVAIYDARETQIILARDRFGIKPLFHATKDGAIFFSSELKFLRAFVPGGFGLDEDASQAYLDKCLLNASTRTMFAGASELAPGHYLVFGGAGSGPPGPVIRRFWTFEPDVRRTTLDEAVEEFGAIFADSLKLRMRSDVEVGTLLSGGLDSTLIVCALERLGLMEPGSFDAFSAVFAEEAFSEKPYIDMTIEKTGVRPHFVYPTSDGALTYLDRVLAHVEEPFRSLSVFAQYLVYESVRANSDVKVVLNGQGSDELFGGYSYHYWWRFGSLAKRLRLGRLLREARALMSARGVDGREVALQTLKNLIKALPHHDYYTAMSFSELSSTALREYLTYDDRNSMAFGVEVRLPFLDYRLVEFAFGLDEDLKIDGLESKLVERRWAEGKIPEPILRRTDKMGFVSPQEQWQRQEPMRTELARGLDAIRRDSRLELIAARPGLIDMYAGYLDGANDRWDAVWRAYCLYRWMAAVGFA